MSTQGAVLEREETITGDFDKDHIVCGECLNEAEHGDAILALCGSPTTVNINCEEWDGEDACKLCVLSEVSNIACPQCGALQ